MDVGWCYVNVNCCIVNVDCIVISCNCVIVDDLECCEVRDFVVEDEIYVV